MNFLSKFKKRKSTDKKNEKTKKETEKRKRDKHVDKSEMSKQSGKKRKPLIKSKRQRRREKENRDRNFDMFRGWFGDRDTKTKQGLINAFLVLLAFATIALGVLLTFSGFAKRQEYLKTNTTPIGEDLKFKSSEAKLKFGGAWTDKNRDVTVVKLGYNKKAREELSTKGTQYKLFVVDNDNKIQKHAKISYGILGTQGDGFLIIDGKLDKKAYQIVMTNQLKVTKGDSTEETTGDKSDAEKLANSNDKLTQSEIESSLSGTEAGDVDSKGRIDFTKNSSKPSVDYIDFRVNAYSEKTKVLKDSLRKPDGSIDYSKILDKTTLNKMIKKIDGSIKAKKNEIKRYKSSRKEFEDRVKENKSDDDAKSNVDSLKKKIEEDEDALDRLENLKDQYENEEFDKSSFGDMQEKYKVIHS
ncbi:hypothetical protein [Staphylococcus pettenkoferi]|uniref:hypothetical protein n=1 Tax=Staphylococcus pettenkoferi TaxID=170573 RepID=UPI0025549680|nr:hypothetical protein [Staphylococcus pettenkoferi]MDK7284302.1 hypothetical protein [Staphylococcus pettenkoferi]